MAFGSPVLGTTRIVNGDGGYTVALPASGLTHDVTLMVLALYCRATSGSISVSAGWNQILNSTTTGGIVIVYTRVYQTGDTAPTVTLTSTPAGSAGAGVIIARDGAQVPDVEWVDSGVDANASAEDIGPISGITTVSTADSWVLAIGGRRSIPGGSGTGIATLSGDLTWTERMEQFNFNGDDCIVALDDAIDSTGNTAIGNKTFDVTGTSAGSEAGAGCMVAFTGTEVLGGGGDQGLARHVRRQSLQRILRM